MPNASAAQALDEWRLNSDADLTALREHILEGRDPDRPEIVICHGTGCMANGSLRVSDAIRAALDKAGIDAKVIPGIKTTGCQGFCSRGPLVSIKPQGLFYQHVKPNDAEEIIQKTLIEGEAVERLLYTDPKTGDRIQHARDIPFYKLQQRVVLHNIGKIDPTDIMDTIAAGGYLGNNRLCAAHLVGAPGRKLQSVRCRLHAAHPKPPLLQPGCAAFDVPRDHSLSG